MKKKQLNHNGLSLNKRVISNLELGTVKGGRTQSCFIFVDTACAHTVGCNHTNDCPPPPSDACTNGCDTSVISASCPQMGNC
jgi:hypothetical protein